MNQSIKELERDIEETRARLDLTIDRLQDRLSMSGLVDDVVAQVRRSGYSSAMDRALATVRENPVPVLLMVAGLGWLLTRLADEGRSEGRAERFTTARAETPRRWTDTAPEADFTQSSDRQYAPSPLPERTGTGEILSGMR